MTEQELHFHIKMLHENADTYEKTLPQEVVAEINKLVDSMEADEIDMILGEDL